MAAAEDHDDENVRRYLEGAAEQPVLSKQEERELGRAAVAGDESARETLVRCNLRLVVALARRYRATGVPFVDLLQEGNLGLMRAVERFDPERGFAFSSFATWFIRQALGNLVREATELGTLGVVQHAWDDFVALHGRQPTLAELASEVGLAEDELTDLLGRPPD